MSCCVQSAANKQPYPQFYLKHICIDLKELHDLSCRYYLKYYGNHIFARNLSFCFHAADKFRCQSWLIYWITPVAILLLLFRRHMILDVPITWSFNVIIFRMSNIVVFCFFPIFFIGIGEASSLFREVLDDRNAENEEGANGMILANKAFHQCSINQMCHYVVQSTETLEFTSYSEETQLPRNKTALRIWKKESKGK